MAESAGLIVGEYARTLDERYRLSLPPELHHVLFPAGSESCVVVKERSGCLSVWPEAAWRDKVQSGLELIRQKLAAHRFDASLGKLQQFGRLLSSRFREVNLGDRGRLVLPEGFREFLEVAAGSDVIVVGAAICIELWHPDKWRQYLSRRMPRFNRLFEELSA
jgi:MraZ protein